MMTQITKVLETETGHRLVNYNGKCAHLHGHRYRWEVTVTAHKLDQTGFVVDYSILKKIMQKVIGPLDHAMLLSNLDPLYLHNKADIHVLLRATNGDTPRLFILPFNPTSENLVDWAAKELQEQFPEYLMLHRVRVWETSESFAERVFREAL